jgi:hypothetical protein
MPPRTYHAVATVDRSGFASSPALLHGVFYDTRLNMEATLAGLIECAIWHEQWTNSVYGHRFRQIAYMLKWHVSKPRTHRLFKKRSLYALLFISCAGEWLLPIESQGKTQDWLRAFDPGDPSANIAVSTESREVFNWLYKTSQEAFIELSATDAGEFIQFQNLYVNYYKSELARLLPCLE